MSSAAQKTAQNNMWVFTIQGVLTILFGLAAVFWPGLTLVTFVYLFSAFILIAGVMGLISSLLNLYDRSRSAMSRVFLGLLSVAEIAVGVYLFRHPLVSLSTFALIVGLILLAKGVIEIIAGVFENASGAYKTAVVIAGVITALAGIVVLMYPASSGIAFVWVLGIFALISGPMMIATGVSARNELEGKN